MKGCFPESKFLGEKVEVELDLSNYAAIQIQKMQQELMRHLLIKRLI